MTAKRKAKRELVRAMAGLPDTSKVSKQAHDALAFAREVQVNNDHAYTVVGEFLAGLKELKRVIDATFDPIVKANHAAWKLAIEKKKEHSGPVEEAERLVAGKLSAYRLEAERRARAEEERQRAEALAEAERQRAEQAAALERAGDSAAAKVLMNAPLAPILPVVAVQGAPTIEGLTTRERWTFRIVEPSLLPREYLVPDETRIRGVVARLGPDARIPGVEVYRVTDYVHRRGTEGGIS